ncbi:/ dnaE / DNA polymerase III subunit alpha /:302079 Forward [Candidatus Hepatoplasma crinochetorum]|uniref:DNA-directed DNA polymerase n=1 Tax=Candidatus Hepatoplasma crinochetorum TaxID=295596 RepID=A0A0G7ZMQ9_9MOLU|nr:/ dnaE / DNA polymerase III subunit alpha /:302079 Forward [Candidatus Hepatoplasma crinochetorum]
MKQQLNLNLITKSSFNFFTSLLKLDDIIDFSLKNNYENACLIEKDTMYLIYPFIKACDKNNLKAIVGLEISSLQIILFAKNLSGYYKLIKISSLINTKKELNIEKYLKDSDLIILADYQNFPQHLFLKNEQSEALEIFAKIGNKKLPEKIDKLLQSDEFIEKYGNDIFIKYQNIIKKIDLKFDFSKKFKLPDFEIDSKFKNQDQYLYYLLTINLKNYFKKSKYASQHKNIYQERVEYEFSVIKKTGFTNYFLIVFDLIRYARKKDIYVGPGRGSSSGSIVSFLLNITLADPIKSNLYFERFLNPARITFPDIDIDIEDERRDELFLYLRDKYGSDYFAQIITFQSLKAKMSLKDIFRFLKISPAEANKITKLLDDRITLQQSYDHNKNFKYAIEENHNFKKGYEIAKEIEGLPRQFSTHAAGIVISHQKISNLVPIQAGYSKDYNQTQYSMNYLEENQLLKMDLLGLRNLTFLKKILNLIKESKNKEIDLKKINYQDQNVFKLLSQGKTLGIFQLESIGMSDVLIKIKPTEFEDIVATISLFRPGPMKQIDHYIKRKHQIEKITYLVPQLESILKKTYGIIIYQEQIMEIAQKIANFSLAKADLLRKAISKKNSDELNLLKNDFINGAINNNFIKEDAIKIYDLIFEFALYGFNRSHAVSYSFITYWLAYLKTYFPQEFIVCLLNQAIGNDNKTIQYIEEAQFFKIKISYPDINNLNYNYFLKDNQIFLALEVINELGKQTINDLLKERKEGIYQDFIDFVVRTQKLKLSRKQLEFLIKGGALDNFNLTRNTMLNNLDLILEYAKLVLIKKDNSYKIDYSIVSEKPILKEAEKENYQKFEKEALGFLLEANDFIKYQNKLTVKQKENLLTISEIENEQDKLVKVFGVINSIRKIKTKRLQEMSFIEIKDNKNKISITIWPNQFKVIEAKLKIGIGIIIRGKIDLRRTRTIILEQAEFIE